MILELHHINFSRQRAPLLMDVTLKIPAKKMLAIMGLNGSGKTTLTKIMSGALVAQSGQCLLHGKKIQDYSAQQRARRLAYVPQDFPTHFPYTLKEFVLMGRFVWQEGGFFYKKEDHDKVAAALEKLDLTPMRNRSIATLSGGERQRALIARALVQDSEVMIFDEPVNHLDMRHRIFLLDFLQCLREQGKTIIAVMHDLQDVRGYFEDVILLDQGKVICHDSVSKALTADLVSQVFRVNLEKLSSGHWLNL